jgi:hypothetical protein
MASREPITLTSAEVHALAERLRARATSVVLRGAPSQQSDGILAAGALLHLVADLRTLRGQIERAASSASEVAQHLRELLDDRGTFDRGASRSDSTDERKRGLASACRRPRVKRSDDHTLGARQCLVSYPSGRSTRRRRSNDSAASQADAPTCRPSSSGAGGDGSDSAPVGA